MSELDSYAQQALKKTQESQVEHAIQAGRVGSMAIMAITFGWDGSAYALAREAAHLGLAAINARAN